MSDINFKRRLDERWSHPYKFSFKDGLASAFAGTYLFIVLAVFFGYGNMAVLNYMENLVMTILIGYFGHEAVRMGAEIYRSRNIGYNVASEVPMEPLYQSPEYGNQGVNINDPRI